MTATLNDQPSQPFRLRLLPLMVGLALLAMGNQQLLARSNETAAAFTATQLVRQFTLKNTVAQVNQGMQGYVEEVNGQLRSEGMGPTPTNYPLGMGSVPATVNLPQRDGAGRPLGYCAWDNSSSTSNASYLAGSGVTNPLVHAVISPGLNGTIETTCAQILANGFGNNDDYVLTTAPTQASSRQFRSSVGTEAELFAMSGENGDVRLVTETNRLYSYLNGSWSAIGPASTFTDDSAANGAGAISYTGGKVTVGDFQAGSAVITGAFTAGSLAGNGSGLTDLNMSNAGSGVLSAAFGGTGVDSSAAANGQLLIGNGSGFSLGGLTAGAGIGVATGAGTITISNTGVTSLAGTLDQVIVNGATGDITLSLPQAIGTTSSPTFGGMSLNGALAGTDASFTGAVNVGSLSVAGVPATLAFTYSNSTGDPVYLDNLALGAGALAGEKRGGNVALGPFAMSSMVASASTTHGVRNTALGSVAMYFNQTGRDNVAVGEAALFGNTTGDFNTAVGRTAIYSNTTGSFNSAFGERALFSNTTGQFNTAIGQSALFNSTGNRNTALGQSVLFANTTGADNTAVGQFALGSNITGSNNVALGQAALAGVTSGQYSTGLGQGADVTSGGLNYATAIGASSRVSTADTLVLGSLAAGKNSAVSTSDDQVVIGATGRNDTQLNTKLFVNGAVNIADKLFVNGVEVVAGAGTNASDINSGLLATTYGGTGVNGSAAANGQLLIGNGTGYTLANITGTANQINVVNGAGSIALSLPQNIATTSTPTFGGMILNGGLSGTTGMFTGAVTASRLNVGTLEGVVNTNTIIGLNAIEGVQSGFGSNVAVGQSAMRFNTSGAYNVGVGLNALSSNTTGNFNSALGEAALPANTTGSSNVAIGQAAMFANTTGSGNTAVGVRSLQANTTGYSNAALGERSLQANTTGVFNTALGDFSLADNISGGRNTAVGSSALGRNTTGLYNTALGRRAGHSNLSGDATNANVTGSYNTFLGAYAMPGTTVQLDHATAIGAEALVTSNDTLVLGRAITDQVVIGATGRNDTQLNTRLYVNGAVTITDKLFVNGIEINKNGTTNASDINSGLLATTYGGTGVNGSAAANGQLLIGNGSGYTLGNITGTANQVTVTNGAGTITLGLPQDIAITSTPTFGGLTLNGALSGTAAAFSGAVGALRLDVGSSVGDVTNPNLIVGSGAMIAIPTGAGANTAVGISALSVNTSGASNTAVGFNALRLTSTGGSNSALGASALLSNSTGLQNTALGAMAMLINNSGSNNTALGYRALDGNTSGSNNLALGASADVSVIGLSFASAIGSNASVGSSNTLVLGRTATDQVVIGSSSRNDTQLNTRLYVNGAVNIADKLFVNGVEITPGSTNASDIDSGLLGTAFGGTGVDGSVAANGQLLIGNGSGYTLGNISGTANQVIVSNGSGMITLGLPQAIATTSAPTFGGMTLSGGLAGTVASFSGAVTAQRLNVGSSAGGVNFPNIMIGHGAMPLVQSGLGANTAIGGDALSQNTTGNSNSATGYRALRLNQSGSYSSAFGELALEKSINGSSNSAFGAWSLRENTTGADNTAVGTFTLDGNTSGFSNTALGYAALGLNTTGNHNLGLGDGAGVTTGNLSYAAGIGAGVRVATSNTLMLGRVASDQVIIGANSRNDTQANTRLYVNGAVNIADKLFVNGVEITASSTNASDIDSGLLGTAFGGTGVDGSAAANGQLLIGNGSGYSLGNITGTANQVTVTNGAGTITLGLPQDIATTSTPTFGGLTLNGALAGTTANFSGRLDAATLFIGGVEVLPVTKASVDAALTFSSDTGDINFNQPNLSLGAGALSASNRAANVAIGASVLGMLTADPDASKGVDNTGVGYRALFSASTGYRNTALGARAAHNLTTGYANTTIGRGAGYGITAGYENTVIGDNALFNGAASYQNIAIGKNSMQAANTAYNNIALGNNSLLVVTSGYENTGIGQSAMNSTTSGFRNIGIGMEALRSNTTGNYNMGIGYRADVTSGNLVYAQAIGNMAQVATSNTLVLGGLGANKFGSTTDDQVVIGATSRNDAEANTVLYVNGTTHINGKLYTTDSHITARMQINTGLPNGLHFGGNTENLDTTSIYRFNQASDQTYLRVRLSDNNQGFGTSFSDEFQIGYQDSGYTPTFRVAGSGDVISSASITATAFNTSSDRRLKNNLQMQDADALLNKLSSLSAYSYDYVGQRDLGRRIGVIAQDMLPLFPEAVNVRPDGFYAVDYGALGALAAAGVGRLNDRVVELDKAFKESGAAQTVARIDTLEGTVTEHGQRIGALESWKLSAEMQLTKTDERLGTLETWRTAATEKMDAMQNAIDLNIQKIADNAVAIQKNTASIERLDDALFTLDGRVKNNSDLINNINARWAQNFNASEDGSVLTVNAVELKVSNFTAQNMRASTVYSQRLEAEMARIAELEVNSLRANSAVANTVQAEQLNTGSTQVYAGVGMPAVLFSAKSDGHYTVNTSALDGSYATATVIVNAGQAKVVAGQNEGIELYAEGNTVKALAAGKSIRASWIKTG